MKRAFSTFKATSAILLKSIKTAEGWDVGIVYHTVSSAEKKEELYGQNQRKHGCFECYAADRTDGELEKCYSIWICRDDIPREDRYSISFYDVDNTKNVGGTAVKRENYDLMTLVIIKLGDEVYNGEKGDEGFELLHFLNAIMYPHREDFIEKISDYIVFSENEELWKEEPHMFSLSQCIYEDGLEEGIEKGIAAFVLDYVEENIPKEKCVQKLQKRFSLTKEKAEEYYERFVGRT